jgi:hypothetical protein
MASGTISGNTISDSSTIIIYHIGSCDIAICIDDAGDSTEPKPFTVDNTISDAVTERPGLHESAIDGHDASRIDTRNSDSITDIEPIKPDNSADAWNFYDCRADYARIISYSCHIDTNRFTINDTDGSVAH